MFMPSLRPSRTSLALGLLAAMVFVSLDASAAFAQKKSIVIGIDGLGFGERGLVVSKTSNIDSLIAGKFADGAYHAAYTDSAYAGGEEGQPTQQPTVSGPGWSTVLTSVWANRHNVTNNEFTRPNYAENPVYLATLKTAKPTLKTASFITWEPIETIILRSIETDDNRENDLDFHSRFENDAVLVEAVVAAMKNPTTDYDAYFVYLGEVDGAGHECGSSGECYQAAIEKADREVGEILAAIAARPNFAEEDWQIVITADHGHKPEGGHGGHSVLERKIPYIVASKTLSQGRLADPMHAVSHADVAPTVLTHFGAPIPAHYVGVSRAAGASEASRASQ